MSFGSRFLPPPTADEQSRQDACRASGCQACHQLGLALADHCGQREFHHFKSGNVTIGQRYGICLGSWHHQGKVKRPLSYGQMLEQYGPSLHDHAGDFHGTFGTDQSLMNAQDDRIGYPRIAIPSRRQLRLERDGVNPRKARKTTAPTKIFKGFPK